MGRVTPRIMRVGVVPELVAVDATRLRVVRVPVCGELALGMSSGETMDFAARRGTDMFLKCLMLMTGRSYNAADRDVRI